MGANDAAEMLEVAKAECLRLERENTALLSRLAEYEAQVAAALALHLCVTIADGEDNAFPACDFCAQEWPCATVAALSALPDPEGVSRG